MTCLELRRRVGAGPWEPDPEVAAHEEECPACAAFARRMRRLDALLGRALQVPAPAGLAPRTLIGHADGDPAGSRRGFLVLAASALLALAGGGAAWWTIGHARAGLAGDVLAIVNTAAFALEADGPVPEPELHAALRPAGLRLERPIGDLTYAGACMVRGRPAGHLVVRGRSAKVTVLLIPHQRVTRRAEFEAFHFRGVLLPAPGGTIAIVGAPGERLEVLEPLVLEAVRWPA